MSNSDLALGSDNVYKSLCHKCPEDEESKEREKKRLIVVSIICVLFMIVEITGGILSNSLAIATDAAHLLTDFAAFMVSLTAIWISSKPQTQTMNFGFHRAEIIGALVSVLSIWLITGILVYLAIERVIKLNYDIDIVLMMYISVAGIAANLIMGIVLVAYKGDSNSIQPTEDKNDSINIKSAILHVLGDLLQSIGVFIASLIMYFKPGLKVVDPICTFIFSVIVLFTTFQVLKDIFRVLMEGVPKHLNFSEVKNILFSIPGVLKIHNMRMWSLTLDKVALSAHIVVSKGESQSQVLKSACQIIGQRLNIYEVTLQIEESGDPVHLCSTCNLPSIVREESDSSVDREESA